MNNTKDQLVLLAEDTLELVKPYYFKVEENFNTYTEGINFTLFCLIYTVLLLVLVSRCSSKQTWRPKNKELKTFRELFKDKFFTFVLSLPIIKQIVDSKFEKSLEKEEIKIIADLQKHWDTKRVSSLPLEGMNDENLKKRLLEWSSKEKEIWGTGRISGAFYAESHEHMKKMSDFAAPYMYHNPLHLDTYREVIRMEKEVLDMTNNLLSSEDKTYYGTITTGGSESLILALYAYRNFYSNRTKPNVVIPVTAHAAIDKGCFYLNIEARKVRLNENYEADLKHMESLIDSNTIMIFASAPNYPHGIIDPIDKIAKLAKKKNVGCHVDGCLGGFVGTFHPDFKNLYSLDREGVTSVSIDHHKFGLAPKGISTIFYKSQELRQAQFYVNTEWKGGLYGTSTFPGSRSGFASAAGWYSLTQVGMKEFKHRAKEISEATQDAANQLRKVNSIKVFGEPKLCVIGFTTSDPALSHLSLGDFLTQEKHWNISTVHKPGGLHISVTHANSDNVRNKLAKDVAEAVEYIKGKGALKESMSSALYGTSTKIPTGGMESQVLKLLLGASMK